MYKKDGGQCTIDSAFGNVNQEFLIKFSQELIHSRSYCAQSIAHNATSMHQSAEWGMRAFQSSMPRIKDRMKFEERSEHKVTLTVMILLYMQTLSLYLDRLLREYSLILIYVTPRY